MDEFLREIHTTIFREWILMQSDPHYQITIPQDNPHHIHIDTEFGKGLITFNSHNIIEFQVTNTFTDEIDFYLHFQMKTLKHALELFYEMIDCLKKLVDKPKFKILLSCSGGLTTSFFASKLNEAAKLLFLDFEAKAVPYNQIFDIGNDYDVILLAPQISYMQAKVQEILTDQIVISIPPHVFAKYDVGALLALMQKHTIQKKEEIKKHNTHNETTIPSRFICQTKILSLSIIRNNKRVHIAYRLYGPQNHILIDKEIIKRKITMNDIYDVIDATLVQYPDIEKIGFSLPGIFEKQSTKLANINGLGDIQFDHIQNRYQQKVIFSNDVNAAAVGYYASQTTYNTLSFLFQPVGSFAGAGIIVNGQLVSGANHLAGEVQYLPLHLKESPIVLTKTPEGTLDVVARTLTSIISIISPEVIVLYCTLIPYIPDLKNEMERHIPREYIPPIIKVEDLNGYSLLGAMILCAQS